MSVSEVIDSTGGRVVRLVGRSLRRLRHGLRRGRARRLLVLFLFLGDLALAARPALEEILVAHSS
jgi:hypothetical protein